MYLIPSLPALPPVASLKDCSDFWDAAYPYLSNVGNYWQYMVNSAYDGDNILTFYKITNPLLTAFLFALAISPIFLLVSEVNKNYSQVDRCWSILPSVFIAHYVGWAHLNGLPTQRLDAILGLSLLWSGGYSVGSEDYRWEIVKSKIPAWLMFVFNVLFISVAQCLLLFAITTPVYVLTIASKINGNALSTADYVYGGLMMSCIIVSYLGDQSQWKYYKARDAYREKAKVPKGCGYTQRNLDLGFNHTGLFAYSRHPNFAAEQGVWLTLWSWGCYKTEVYANWTSAGALGYLILFQASTWFTESITGGKYPEYAEYRRRVSKFLPKVTTFFTGPLPEEWMDGKKVNGKNE